MTTGVLPGSFRDRAGFVWTENDTLYRQINGDYRPDYDHLLSSGLYESLVGKGYLIPHEEVAVEGPRPGAYKVIKPERVAFVSYPYEWCFGQLRDAALLTLNLQKTAMEFGMSLRDASAYNVMFHRGRPVLIDTLSFERYVDGRPWVGYRQFCQHFLAPLALMAYRDVRLGSMLRDHIDGIPLDLATRLLPARTRFRPALFVHLHMHARMALRYAERDVSERVRGRRINKQGVLGLISGLRRAVRSLDWEPGRSGWRDYYEATDHYSATAVESKKALVAELIASASPRTVWDLGGNVGEYSRVAAGGREFTACFDADAACVEVNYRRVRSDGDTGLLPLVCDLANPSPALGWSHRERMSLMERGPADAVLALAFIHHIAIGNNVPFDRIAQFLAAVGSWLVIEFVPPDDPMVRRMLSMRANQFPDYTEASFEHAFSKLFAIKRRERLADSARSIYLMRSRGAR